MVVKGKPQVSNVRDDYIPVYGEGKAIQAGDYAQMAGGSQPRLMSLRLIVCADGLIRAKWTLVDHWLQVSEARLSLAKPKSGLALCGVMMLK